MEGKGREAEEGKRSPRKQKVREREGSGGREEESKETEGIGERIKGN